jgi:DNA-binding transcriptional LysR family regulator
MDRLESMAIFVAAVETGSFSAAGRKLGIPLPTVSRKVSELESHLKTRLLVRTTRKLMLTDSGIAYLAACKPILDRVDEAERAASGEYNEPTGELSVTAPIVFGRLHMLPVVTEFLAAFPVIRVKLMLSDSNLNFADDHLDVSLRIGSLPDSSLVATRVGTVSVIACGSPKFFAAHGVPKTPADLARLPSVSFEGFAYAPSWRAYSKMRPSTQQVFVPPRLTVNTAEAAIDAAIAGVGVAHVLSYQAARAVAAGELQRVLVRHEPEPVPVSLIHAGRALLPLKTRRFLEFAAPRLRQVLLGGPNARVPKGDKSTASKSIG